MSEKVRVLVVGCGGMGASHAKAYDKIDGFEIAGLVARTPKRRSKLAEELGGIPEFDNFEKALAETKPDAVSINTYPNTHVDYALKSFEAGAHVFMEKPIAQTVEDAEKVVAAAKKSGKKLVIGYILRHHPSWTKFVEIARTLGKPLVMRMNLNQQSVGERWEHHRTLIESLPPMVDCGVHYVDMMCLMTQAKPVKVHAIGANLVKDLGEGKYNYGQLQVVFDDGSVGWYEAGWGPMMSETAYFVKDVVGPEGCVSIVSSEGKTESSNLESHTKTNRLKHHFSEMDSNGQFVREDEIIDMTEEPDHQELCDREQAYFLKAIKEDIDLTDHMNDAVNSLKIVLAADQSFRSGEVVKF